MCPPKPIPGTLPAFGRRSLPASVPGVGFAAGELACRRGRLAGTRPRRDGLRRGIDLTPSPHRSRIRRVGPWPEASWITCLKGRTSWQFGPRYRTGRALTSYVAGEQRGRFGRRSARHSGITGGVIGTSRYSVSGETGARQELRCCRVRGCAWRGLCPYHDVDTGDIDLELNKLMRLRPFGAGRKRQRQPAPYRSRQVKAPVVVTSVAERDAEPLRAVRRRVGGERSSPFSYSRTVRHKAALPRQTESRVDTTVGSDRSFPPLPRTVGGLDAAPSRPESADPCDRLIGQSEAEAADTPRPTPATVARLVQAKGAEYGHHRGGQPSPVPLRQPLGVRRRPGRRLRHATVETPVVRRRGRRRSV